MAYVPDLAVRRRHELSHGAWDLYVSCCLHRNRETGRCDPSNDTLAREMGCTKQHLSACKRELIEKGWITPRGRYAVDLQVGKFDKPVVRELSEQRPQIKKIRNLDEEKSESVGSEIKKNLNPDYEFSELHIKEEPPFEPPAAAAAAAAGEKDFSRQVCTEKFVAEVKRTGVFGYVDVDHVWRKLKLQCALEGREPEKGRLLHWLKTEHPAPAQPLLPTVGAQIVEGKFQSRAAQSPMPEEAALPAPAPECGTCHGDPTFREGTHPCSCRVCRFCFGVGMEVVPGKGARRCRCRQPEQAQGSPPGGEKTSAAGG